VEYIAVDTSDAMVQAILGLSSGCSPWGNRQTMEGYGDEKSDGMGQSARDDGMALENAMRP
jgi:hypothetical protein